MATISLGSIAFGHELYGYRNQLVTVPSVVSLMLGKFEVKDFQEASRILGPVFFIYFNVFINMILVNMIIAIIDEAYHKEVIFSYLKSNYSSSDYH